MKHIIESQQFSKDFLFDLFQRADEMKKNPPKSLTGKIMSSLFYEPSTRTRLSFESAMIKLGGSVIGTENANEFSSAVKGESLEDTIRVISKYVDIIVLRHFEEGSAEIASNLSSVPIINAGDGKGQHPTQSLLDLYTVFKEIGRIDSINIAIVGDLLNGRTARSLCYLLGKFENNLINLVSPKELIMKEDIKEYLARKNVKFKEKSDLNKIVGNMDIIYMTRIQKERMNPETYEKANGKYIINEEKLKLIKESARILHPLPHVEEIDLPIEIEKNDKRIAYFRQAENGLYIRMALLDYILNNDNKN